MTTMTDKSISAPAAGTIEAMRAEIDAVDTHLLELVNRRMELAEAIGREKRKTGRPILDNHREEEIIHRLKTGNHGPLTDSQVERLFRTVISFSRQLQVFERIRS